MRQARKMRWAVQRMPLESDGRRERRRMRYTAVVARVGMGTCEWKATVAIKTLSDGIEGVMEFEAAAPVVVRSGSQIMTSSAFLAK